jgi:hypothetical protein
MEEQEIEKAVIGSVRLDSDVWEAVRAMPESLNVYLRRGLLGGGLVSRKISKKQAQVDALRASDPLATIMEREDIEHGNMDLPSSGSIATLDAVSPVANSKTGKASVQVYQNRMRQKGDKTR